MDGKIIILVEGEEKKFFSDYLKYLKLDDADKFEILSAEGWTNLHTFASKFQENTDNRGVNLVIFDADADMPSRRDEIIQTKREKNMVFELFLFPNDKDTGTFETLLENIINPKNSPIFDCWQKYELCLQSKRIEGRKDTLTIPAKKSKIYCYLETLLGTTQSQKKLAKDPNRDYQNTNHWNLDSEYLLPLKKFLIDNIG